MKRCLLLTGVFFVLAFSALAEKSYAITDFRVRDPFVVNAGGERPYLLFMSDSWRKTGRGSKDWCAPGVQTVSFSRSADLVHWSEPETCMTAPEWCGQIWAPEIHEWKGKWYMFVTLKERPGYGEPIRSMVPGEPDWEYNRGSRTNSTCHALWMYRADRPEGPYLPIVDGPLTEKGYISLDGTLGVEDGNPWMVYTHDWAQIRVGTYELRPLSDDLTHFIGPAKTLFTAAAMPMCKGMGVTDGAFLYRSPKSGKLFMTWSTHDPKRTPGHDYCVVLCESATGKLAGPWVNHRYLSSDGCGHGHFFRDRNGRLMFVAHQEPATGEYVRLFEVIDEGDTLRFGRELRPGAESLSAVELRTKDANCRVDLDGGRVVSYVCRGEEQLWMPDQPSDGRSWRHGGIPMCWPWFGVNAQGEAHGTAWRSVFTLAERTETADESRADLVLREGEHELRYRLTLTDRLRLEAETVNGGTNAFTYTVGFHPYFRVSSRNACSVGGLDGLSFVDDPSFPNGTNGVWHGLVCTTSRIDRIYALTDGVRACELCESNGRTRRLTFEGFTDVNVWNPETDPEFDGILAPGAWRNFLCVEPVRFGAGDEVTLAPSARRRHVFTIAP